MTYISQTDIERFKESGSLLIRNVFSPNEIAEMREGVQQVKQTEVSAKTIVLNPLYPKATFFVGDVLGKSELKAWDYIILDERLIDCAKGILGDRVVYFGDSTIHIGEGPRGFHKDNSDRSDGSGLDWQSEYNIIRFGIYLQDHSRHSGGLKVRVRSHQYVSHHRGRAVNLASRPGDIVVWNLRTSHSGNNVRLKFLSDLCLHPRLERLVPQILRVPEHSERIAIFCSFGAPGNHLERYIQFLQRKADFTEHWKRSGLNEEILKLAGQRGVEIRTPIPEYGSLCLARKAKQIVSF